MNKESIVSSLIISKSLLFKSFKAAEVVNSISNKVSLTHYSVAYSDKSTSGITAEITLFSIIIFSPAVYV